MKDVVCRAGLAAPPVPPLPDVFRLASRSVELTTRQLGRGTFADVFVGSWAGTQVAVKLLRSGSQTDAAARAELESEQCIWARLHHPHICQFIGTLPMCALSGAGQSQDFSAPCLVLEWCVLGNLQAYLSRVGTGLKFEEALRLTTHIASGMAYLHGSRPLAVMHRDLKPANCLLCPGSVVKLADFGLSRLVLVGDGEETPLDEPYLLTGETGAYKYMAVELVR